MGNYNENMFGWSFGGGFMMILFWVAIIIFIVWIVREMGGKNHSDKTSGPKTSIDILKERYAKGEITKEQFESMKKDIIS